MASAGHSPTDDSFSDAPDDDLNNRGEGSVKRKRTFHPFRAVRNIFRRANKRQGEDPTSASKKSRSTSELSTVSTDSQQQQAGLLLLAVPSFPSGGLSVSHESIFASEAQHQGEQPQNLSTQRLKGLKDELMNRVRARRDSDSDDAGLPQSPCTSPTTADILSRGLLQDKPCHSRSTCSAGSLISMGSSENDEDSMSFFGLGPSSRMSYPDRRPFDLDGMGADGDPATAPLNHQAAHHKIAVRPKRTHGLPRHRKLQLANATGVGSLPSTPELMEDMTSAFREITEDNNKAAINDNQDLLGATAIDPTAPIDSNSGIEQSDTATPPVLLETNLDDDEFGGTSREEVETPDIVLPPAVKPVSKTIEKPEISNKTLESTERQDLEENTPESAPPLIQVENYRERINETKEDRKNIPKKEESASEKYENVPQIQNETFENPSPVVPLEKTIEKSSVKDTPVDLSSSTTNLKSTEEEKKETENVQPAAISSSNSDRPKAKTKGKSNAAEMKLRHEIRQYSKRQKEMMNPDAEVIAVKDCITAGDREETKKGEGFKSTVMVTSESTEVKFTDNNAAPPQRPNRKTEENEEHKLRKVIQEKESKMNSDAQQSSKGRFMDSEVQQSSKGQFMDSDAQHSSKGQFMNNKSRQSPTGQITNSDSQQSSKGQFTNSESQQISKGEFMNSKSQQSPTGQIANSDSQQSSKGEFMNSESQQSSKEKFMNSKSQQSPKGQFTNSESQQSPKGQFTNSDSQQSPKGQFTNSESHQSSKGQVTNSDSQQNSKGQLTNSDSQQSSKGQLTNSESQQSSKEKSTNSESQQSSKGQLTNSDSQQSSQVTKSDKSDHKMQQSGSQMENRKFEPDEERKEDKRKSSHEAQKSKREPEMNSTPKNIIRTESWKARAVEEEPIKAETKVDSELNRKPKAVASVEKNLSRPDEAVKIKPETETEEVVLRRRAASRNSEERSTFISGDFEGIMKKRRSMTEPIKDDFKVENRKVSVEIIPFHSRSKEPNKSPVAVIEDEKKPDVRRKLSLRSDTSSATTPEPPQSAPVLGGVGPVRFRIRRGKSLSEKSPSSSEADPSEFRPKSQVISSQKAAGGAAAAVPEFMKIQLRSSKEELDEPQFEVKIGPSKVLTKEEPKLLVKDEKSKESLENKENLGGNATSKLVSKEPAKDNSAAQKEKSAKEEPEEQRKEDSLIRRKSFVATQEKEAEPELFRVFARRSIKQRNPKNKVEEQQNKTADEPTKETVTTTAEKPKDDKIEKTKKSSAAAPDKTKKSSEKPKQIEINNKPEEPRAAPPRQNRFRSNSEVKAVLSEPIKTPEVKNPSAAATATSSKPETKTPPKLLVESRVPVLDNKTSSTPKNLNTRAARPESIAITPQDSRIPQQHKSSSSHRKSEPIPRKLSDAGQSAVEDAAGTPRWMQLAQQRREQREQKERMLYGSSANSFSIETGGSNKPSRNSKVLDLVNNFQKLQTT